MGETEMIAGEIEDMMTEDMTETDQDQERGRETDHLTEEETETREIDLEKEEDLEKDPETREEADLETEIQEEKEKMINTRNQDTEEDHQVTNVFILYLKSHMNDSLYNFR